METKDSRIDELIKEKDEFNKELSQLKKELDKQTNTLKKCLTVNKKLLIEKVCVLIQKFYSPIALISMFKSTLEKKQARQKCMENRLRLGQFVTQRQGATFVENWVDGYAFNDIMK